MPAPTPSCGAWRARLSWLLATTHTGYSPFVTPSAPQLGWGLMLRVHDPLEQGYALKVETRLRGRLGGLIETTGLAMTEVPLLEFGVYEMFATKPRALFGADTTAHDAPVFGFGSPIEIGAADNGHAPVGRYSGTRDFLFFMQDASLEHLAVSAFTDSANAWQQFGLAADLVNLDFANHPSNGADLRDLGPFFRVSANFDATPIPEPGSWALLVAGLGVVLLRRRLMSAGTATKPRA